MKKKIDKNVRIGLFGISVLLVLVSLILMYGKGIKKYDREETNVVYEYEKMADVDYQVNLKQNSLYNMDSVPEGTYYITAFTKSIDTFFRYQFSGETGTKIEGRYDITALIEGYEAFEEEEKVLWKKEFTIKPSKSFKGVDQIEIVEDKISVNLAEYIGYVEKFIEESEVNSLVKLTVAMNVNLSAITPKGNVEEVTSPAIVIPLNESFIDITKMNTIEDTGVIEEREIITIGPRAPAIIAFSLISVTFFALSIYIALFTVGVEKDPLKVYIRRIFKNYGSRLVALNQEIHIPSNNILMVYSIEDLVKIADEVAMPIFYRYNAKHEEINEFYVFQEQSSYCLLTKEGLKEQLYRPGKMKQKPLVALEESQ